MVPKFHYSLSYIESARQLSATNPAAWAGVSAATDYLRNFMRSAVAPDVRWHIQESAFAQDCGEIRWPDPEGQAAFQGIAVRGLFVAHPSNEWCVFTVLGNKAVGPARGNAWYRHAVEQSDLIVHQAIAALGLTPITGE